MEVDQDGDGRGRIDAFGALTPALVRPRPADAGRRRSRWRTRPCCASGHGFAAGSTPRGNTSVCTAGSRPPHASGTTLTTIPSFLLRGGNLAQFELLADESDIALTELEREFIDASRSANELELARRQRQNRRLKLSLAGVGVLLALAVVAGIIALLQRQSAKHQATVALARQLGSEAVVEPRIDRAMLLAHESVNLDGSPETEGTLLATLLRSPAAVATFTLPIDVRPCCGMSVSPDGGTLAISDNANNVRFVDTKTRRVRKVVANFGYTQPVAYAADGSALLDFGGERTPEISVLDPSTLRLKRTCISTASSSHGRPRTPPDPLVLSPNGSALFLVYDVLLPNGAPGEAFVDRWRLRTGKLEATVGVGVKGARAAALVTGGRRLLLAGNSQLTVLDAATLKRVRTVRFPQGPWSRSDQMGGSPQSDRKQDRSRSSISRRAE